MRSYNSKAVAVTIGQPVKWLDNLLSHHVLPGVARGRQGIERRISYEGILAIELVRTLTVELGVPAARAANVARVALTSRSAEKAVVSLGAGVTLLISVSAIEQRLQERMRDAVETVSRVRRGRPRRSG